MKTIVEALKGLLTKWGGTGSPKTVSEAIDALTAVAPTGGGGGSDLPAVTSDDNGDVLTVVEGAWAKADPPSGLPAVTSSDNGDVLTVQNGAWAKSDPPYDFLFVSAFDGEAQTMTVESGSYSAVVAKLKAGEPVFGRMFSYSVLTEEGSPSTQYIGETYEVGLSYTEDTGDPSANILTFSFFAFANGTVNMFTGTWYPNDTLVLDIPGEGD